MLTIYGSDRCPDCIQCKEELDKAGVAYTYLSITEDLPDLKQYLLLRDTRAEFAEIRGTERIGIPCILDDQGNIFFEWGQFMK